MIESRQKIGRSSVHAVPDGKVHLKKANLPNGFLKVLPRYFRNIHHSKREWVMSKPEEKTSKPSENTTNAASFEGESHPLPKPPESRVSQLWLGLLFGVLFGFLLQKGGVAKYEILIGMLLLKDFTVIKVILSAVVVGMIGVSALHRMRLVELKVKPTQYAANMIGGLVFGVGFALSAYCPGTGAAALGQGNFDAIAVIVGLIAGSYLYAEASGWLGRTLKTWGDRGKLTLPELVGVKKWPFIVIFAFLLVLLLSILEFAL
jgi:hypothetical protein